MSRRYVLVLFALVITAVVVTGLMYRRTGDRHIVIGDPPVRAGAGSD